MLPLLLILCCLLSACVGLPSKHARQVTNPENLDDFVFPEWAITDFDATCSPGGCILIFNMSSAATTSEPAIDASCNLNGDDIKWQLCSSKNSDLVGDAAVWAMPLNSVDTFEVSIQHRFANASTTPTRVYNVTGNMTVDFEKVSMPANLTVMGTSVTEYWWWLKVRSTIATGRKGCVGQHRRVCEPILNADGSIDGFAHLENEIRSVQRD